MLHDVLADIEVTRKRRGGKDTIPRKYVTFELSEWQATIDKAFGREVGVAEIKALLVAMCKDVIIPITKARHDELLAMEALVKETKPS